MSSGPWPKGVPGPGYSPALTYGTVNIPPSHITQVWGGFFRCDCILNPSECGSLLFGSSSNWTNLRIPGNHCSMFDGDLAETMLVQLLPTQYYSDSDVQDFPRNETRGCRIDERLSRAATYYPEAMSDGSGNLCIRYLLWDWLQSINNSMERQSDQMMEGLSMANNGDPIGL